MTYTCHRRLADWMTWFCRNEDHMSGLETILERNPAIREAQELYERFTADEKMMALCEARRKYLADVATFKIVSHDEGYSEGLAKGEEIGLVKGKAEGEEIGLGEGEENTTTAMYRNGIAVEQISQITSKSVEEVRFIVEKHL